MWHYFGQRASNVQGTSSPDTESYLLKSMMNNGEKTIVSDIVFEIKGGGAKKKS